MIITLKILNLGPERREAIIKAALKEFARTGFDKASTNIIARESGFSKGLLFHYVNSKKDLFLFLCDYSLEILKTEFIALINTKERDIFARYRQAAMLKIDLVHKHPYVFDFIGMAAFTESKPVKEYLESWKKELRATSEARLFENIDLSRFRPGVDMQRATNLIVWAIEGYERAAQQKIKGRLLSQIDYDEFLVDFDAYIELLKDGFYQ